MRGLLHFCSFDVTCSAYLMWGLVCHSCTLSNSGPPLLPKFRVNQAISGQIEIQTRIYKYVLSFFTVFMFTSHIHPNVPCPRPTQSQQIRPCWRTIVLRTAVVAGPQDPIIYPYLSITIHVYPAEAWIWPNQIDQIEDVVPCVAGIISDTQREREGTKFQISEGKLFREMQWHWHCCQAFHDMLWYFGLLTCLQPTPFQLILAVQGSGTLPHRASGINIRACWDEGEKINGLSRLSSKKKILQSFTFLCNTVTLPHAVSIFWANMFLQETSTESLPRLDQYVIHCYSITPILFECPS